MKVLGIQVSKEIARLRWIAEKNLGFKLVIEHKDKVSGVFDDSSPGMRFGNHIYLKPEHPDFERSHTIAHEFAHVCVDDDRWPELTFVRAIPDTIQEGWDNLFVNWAQHMAIPQALEEAGCDTVQYIRDRIGMTLEKARADLDQNKNLEGARFIVGLAPRVAESLVWTGPEVHGPFLRELEEIAPSAVALGRRLAGHSPRGGPVTQEQATRMVEGWIQEIGLVTEHLCPKSPSPRASIQLKQGS